MAKMVKKKNVPFVARGTLQKDKKKKKKASGSSNKETRLQKDKKPKKKQKAKKVPKLVTGVNSEESEEEPDIDDINTDYLVVDLAKIRNSGFWFTQLSKLKLQDDILDKDGPLFTSEVYNELGEAGFKTFVIMTGSKFRLFLQDGSNGLQLQFSCYISLIQEVIVETKKSRIATIILKNGKIFPLLLDFNCF